MPDRYGPVPADYWHYGVIGGEDACDESPAFDYDDGELPAVRDLEKEHGGKKYD